MIGFFKNGKENSVLTEMSVLWRSPYFSLTWSCWYWGFRFKEVSVFWSVQNKMSLFWKCPFMEVSILWNVHIMEFLFSGGVRVIWSVHKLLWRCESILWSVYILNVSVFWSIHWYYAGVCTILCTYWLAELGRAGRENIWLEVMAYGPSCAQSVRHHWWPRAKYFPVEPDLTQSISILSYDHRAFPFIPFFLLASNCFVSRAILAVPDGFLRPC